jgi:pyruvate formate lyase activating enzyme
MSKEYDPDLAGTVFNIQRFSVHDGPGIRTVVFLKGCSLRCIWCSNPESLSSRVQFGFSPDRCIGVDKCTACIEAAPDPQALTVRDRRVVGLASGQTDEFLVCADACPTGAIKAWGRRMTVGEIMREVMADRACYAESGGGLTLSGGEALIQTAFAVELLKAARSEGINTCVETALNYKRDLLDPVLPLVDLFLCDLKHMEPAAHRRYTGVSNETILANLRHVVASGADVVIRIPVVPGHNGTEANLRATARFLADELGGRIRQVQLLPFRKLGEQKYASLGIEYPMSGFQSPPRESWERDIRRFAALMSAYGLEVAAGAGSLIRSAARAEIEREPHCAAIGRPA